MRYLTIEAPFQAFIVKSTLSHMNLCSSYIGEKFPIVYYAGYNCSPFSRSHCQVLTDFRSPLNNKTKIGHRFLSVFVALLDFLARIYILLFTGCLGHNLVTHFRWHAQYFILFCRKLSLYYSILRQGRFCLKAKPEIETYHFNLVYYFNCCHVRPWFEKKEKSLAHYAMRLAQTLCGRHKEILSRATDETVS